MSQALSWILKEQWKSPCPHKALIAECIHCTVYINGVYMLQRQTKKKQVRAICHVTENSLNRAVREDLTMREKCLAKDLRR